MSDFIKYMHFGTSLKQSLKDYGMVCRKERSDQYYFVYKVNNSYEESFICESEIKEFMNGESGYSIDDISEFFNVTNYNAMDFIELPILEQVYKLSQHFGIETILGKSIGGLTLETALDMIEAE